MRTLGDSVARAVPGAQRDRDRDPGRCRCRLRSGCPPRRGGLRHDVHGGAAPHCCPRGESATHLRRANPRGCGAPRVAGRCGPEPSAHPLCSLSSAPRPPCLGCTIPGWPATNGRANTTRVNLHSPRCVVGATDDARRRSFSPILVLPRGVAPAVFAVELSTPGADPSGAAGPRSPCSLTAQSYASTRACETSPRWTRRACWRS
jgi:hypothetical protein